jgi:hypothetical protein
MFVVDLSQSAQSHIQADVTYIFEDRGKQLDLKITQ